MDIRMPLKDGIEACREIRKFEKDLPILASSAVISDEKISRCLEAGYTGFVHKPFTEQQLIATVSAAFNGVPFGQQENVSPSAEADLSRFSLEELDRISGGDETFGKELLTLFQQSINRGLEEMDAFTKTNDWDKMADLAHKMIPPCKHFNADKLQLLLRYFEALREKTPRTTEVEANLIALRAEVNAINLQLQLYL